MSIRAWVLDKARAAVMGERQNNYGNPEDNFARIAELWSAYLRNYGVTHKLQSHDVSLMLDLMKTARLQNMPGHADSWIDKAGYAACGAEVSGVEKE